MTINNAPAIRAFAEARAQQLRGTPQTPETKARIEEMSMIVTLCDGLERQMDLLTKEFAKEAVAK